MKILHVIPGLTYERGGPSTVVEALVRRQSESGHEVAVLTTLPAKRHKEHPVKLPDSITAEWVAEAGPTRLSYAPGFAERIRPWLRRSEIVHVHSVFNYVSHVALREAAAASVPLVLRPCGLLHAYSMQRSALRKRIYLKMRGQMVRRACKAWHYTSQREADESWPADASPRFVLPNGIDVEEFALDRDAARRRVQQLCPELAHAPYVLFLGRLHPKKRVDFLLEVFLKAAPASYKLVVAGPSEAGLWEELAGRFLGDAGKAARVVRLGLVRGKDKAALLAGASLFALPSEHENFAVAALEALSAGTPVLLSPYVDLATEVSAAGLGQPVPLDLGAWEEQIHRALTTPDDQRDFTNAARCWVAENFAWSRLADRLTNRYRWVIAGCPDVVFSLST